MEPLRKIFWAFILLFFTLTLSNGAAKIVILPAFVGYLIILSNTKKLNEFTKYFSSIHKPIIVLSFFSVIGFIGSLMGIANFGAPVITILVLFISAGFYIWMIYLMLFGLNDIAKAFGFDFEGNQFIALYPFLAGFYLVSVITVVFMPVIALIASLAELVVHIVFLVRLARFSNLNFVYPSKTEAPVSL